MSLSEEQRKSNSEMLKDALKFIDSLKYQLQEVTSTKSLNEAKHALIEEQLMFLYSSLGQLTNAKNMEDKFTF